MQSQIQPGSMNYTQGFGSSPNSVAFPHLDVRAPSVRDFNLQWTIGKRWVDQVGNAEYVLTSQTTTNGLTSATWTLLGAGTNGTFAGSVTAGTSITAGTLITSGTGFSSTNGGFSTNNGNVVLGTAGNKITIATGTNASIGTSAAMTAGTITVSTTAVTSSSKIFLTSNTPGGTAGTLSAPTASIVNGTSFVINSSNAADTATVNYIIFN